jgi:hypothetical protein
MLKTVIDLARNRKAESANYRFRCVGINASARAFPGSRLTGMFRFVDGIGGRAADEHQAALSFTTAIIPDGLAGSVSTGPISERRQQSVSRIP